MRKASKANGLITIAKIIAINNSSPSEKSNFVNSSTIHELSPEPAIKKFAERISITNPTSSETGRRTNPHINGSGVTAKLALLRNQAYIDESFLEPGPVMTEEPSGIFHSITLPQCGHSKSSDAIESISTSPSQCGQRFATMNIPNENMA